MQPRSTSCIDNWNLSEHLCLASVVRELGDNDWTTISNCVKKWFCERPVNWITPATCEAQYKWLHENHVNSVISCERPADQILEYLKTAAKSESRLCEDQEKKVEEHRKQIEYFSKHKDDPKIVDEFYEDTMRRKREHEENRRKCQEGLKRRDSSRGETDKVGVSKSPSKSDNKTEGSSPNITSPLLSSLLKSPTVNQQGVRTVSTKCFISNKPIQGSNRVNPSDSVQTTSADISFKDTFNADMSDPSPRISGRTSGLYGKTMSAVRVLDFPDVPSSSSATSNPRLPVVAEVSEAPARSETTIKPDAQNLEQLIATNEDNDGADLPTDLLLQVIDNFKENPVLDKVISQLTGNAVKDVIMNAEPADVSIPADTSFVTVSESNESTTSLSADASQSIIVDASMKSEPGEPTSLSDGTQIGVETDPVGEHVEESNASIVVSESSPIVETVTLNPDSSSFSSLAISIGSDSVSEMKSDSEPLIEYLDASAVDENSKLEYSRTENHQPVKLEETKPIDGDRTTTDEPEVHVKMNEVADASNETRESADGYETCESLPDAPVLREPIAISEPNAFQVMATPETKPVVATQAKSEPVDEYTFVDETNEVTATPANDPKKADDIAEIPVEERPGAEVKTEAASNVLDAKNETSKMVVEEMSQHEDENPVAVPLIEAPEIRPDVLESTVTVPEPKDAKTESTKVDVPAEADQPNDAEVVPLTDEQANITTKPEVVLRTNAPTPATVTSAVKVEVIEDEAKPTHAARNARKYSGRKRRSTISESGDGKMAKTLADLAEQREDEMKEEDRVKELNISIRDFREELDPLLTQTLLKPKEEPVEPVERRVPPLEVATSVKPKVETVKEERRSSGGKDSKSRTKITRKPSLRNQSQTPKAIETPPSSRSKMSDSQQATRKKSLVLAHQRLTQLKYSNTFLRPITNKQAAGYEDVIYCPIDLQTMKRKIDSKQISSVVEFQRDVLLMINNAKMFNRMHTQVYNMAVEVQREALADMELTVKTLGEGILLSINEESEKVRKRQSLDNAKRDQKPVKRTKLAGKDEVPIKKIKLEENDVDNQS